MSKICFGLAAALSLCGLGSAAAGTVNLGAAASYAVLATSTVTNTGATVINGDLGLTGSSVTGFPPGVIHGAENVANGAATQAESDAMSAYTSLSSQTVTQVLTGEDLGGMTLTPGVYEFASSAQLTGQLTLDGAGQYVFLIGSTLTTASASSLTSENGANALDVYWDVGSSATLGANTAFEGTILAAASVTLTTGATIVEGRALALDGAVTLDTNTLTAPEPSTWAMLLVGFAGVAFAGVLRTKRALSAI